MLPLNKKLRKRLHRTIALAQDILVMEVYEAFPSAVIHGGTAIWRCYGSNRFSEDIDVYLPEKLEEANFERLLDGLRERTFSIEKFKKTENSMFSKFSFSDTFVRLEAVFKDVKSSVLKRFEMVDGNYMLINTLMPEEMIKEKILAYIERKKIRDLYDIFFLSKIAKRDKIKKDLLKAVGDFEKPIDEGELKTLIIFGSIPKADYILKEVKEWAK